MIGGDIVPTENSFQEKMFMLMKEMTGSSNNIAVSRLYCKAMGGLTGGVFLSQLVYWCDKGAREDGYIWKTNEEWEEETYLSKYEVTKARKVLEDVGVLETMVKKVCGNPTLHYKLLREPFIDWLVKFFTKENENLEEGKSNVSLSITKNTFPNTTAENTTTEPADQPKEGIKPVAEFVVAPILKTTGEEPISELPKGIKPTLISKLISIHGQPVVDRQIKNLKAEQSKHVVKNPAGWLTTACNEGFDSKVEADLFALQESKELEIKLVEKLNTDSSAPHEFVNPDFMQALIAKHGCISDLFNRDNSNTTVTQT